MIAFLQMLRKPAKTSVQRNWQSVMRGTAFLAAAAMAMGVAAPASATVYGVYGDSSAQSVSLIKAQGDTASVLSDLSAASLAGINVLWVLNGNNAAQPAALTTYAASIAGFVSGGGTFAYHDQNPAGAAAVVPGAGGISFSQAVTRDVNVILNGTLLTNGPGGVITNTTLDGGNTQATGYAALNTLPAGAVAPLSSTSASQVVAFSYAQGAAGHVYYSTIPLNFFLSYPTDNTAKIYGPNLVAYLDGGSAGPTPIAIPEPGSLMLLGVGLLGFGLIRRQA